MQEKNLQNHHKNYISGESDIQGYFTYQLLGIYRLSFSEASFDIDHRNRNYWIRIFF